LNCTLDGATLVPEIRKPFDVLAEGLLSEKSRDNRTSIELFQRGLKTLASELAIAGQILMAILDSLYVAHSASK